MTVRAHILALLLLTVCIHAPADSDKPLVSVQVNDESGKPVREARGILVWAKDDMCGPMQARWSLGRDGKIEVRKSDFPQNSAPTRAMHVELVAQSPGYAW